MECVAWSVVALSLIVLDRQAWRTAPKEAIRLETPASSALRPTTLLRRTATLLVSSRRPGRLCGGRPGLLRYSYFATTRRVKSASPSLATRTV
jgi:hypothetical protein